MKLIIDIDEMEYSLLKECAKSENYSAITRIIANGIPYEERPKGEWIKEPNGRTTDIYRCSVCKRSIMLCKGANLTNYPFCHCGADMGGNKNDK